MNKNIISDILTIAGVTAFVVGILIWNLFLIIFGIISMIVSIFLPYTE
ncbi:MAG: hypothetical protein ACFFD2_05835 [Promethearchaeota archaeon]